MKKAALFLLVIFGLNACKTEDKLQTVTIEKKYSVEVPDFLTKGDKLHPDASLQYQNLTEELYIIVIDELKSDVTAAAEQGALGESFTNDLKGYAELTSGGFSGEGFTKSAMRDTIINSLPAKTMTAKGKVDNNDVFYSVAWIEGKKAFFQVMTWTLASKEEKHKERMNKMIASLKEL